MGLVTFVSTLLFLAFYLWLSFQIFIVPVLFLSFYFRHKKQHPRLTKLIFRSYIYFLLFCLLMLGTSWLFFGEPFFILNMLDGS